MTARLSIVSMMSTTDMTTTVLIAPARQNAGSLKCMEPSTKAVFWRFRAIALICINAGGRRPATGAFGGFVNGTSDEE
jgi:hypothetical protein